LALILNDMKKISHKLLVASFGVIVCLSLGLIGIGTLHAQSNTNQETPYVPLEPLPGLTVTRDGTETIDIVQYLPNLIKLAIGIASALCVIYIILGGFEYIASDVVFKKEEGRKRIQNALLGLLLAIGSWVILNTISPNITNVSLNIPPTTAEGAATSGTTITAINCPRSGQSYQGSCVCDNCKAIGGLLPRKGGQTYNGHSAGLLINEVLLGDLASMGVELGRLGGFGGWWITEAWIPSVPHKSSCHYTGHCADANLTRNKYDAGTTPSRDTVRDINAVCNIGKASGLSVVFEVSPVSAQLLKTAGVVESCLAIVTPEGPYELNTAPSFHIR